MQVEVMNPARGWSGYSLRLNFPSAAFAMATLGDGEGTLVLLKTVSREFLQRIFATSQQLQRVRFPAPSCHRHIIGPCSKH